LRIAVFSYGLPTIGQKRGGIERVAHDLADGLARRGHEVVVWTHDPRPDGAAYTVRPLPWKSFVTSWLGRRLTMGYLGNVLALLPDYHAAEVIIAIGDSLLLPLAGKPLARVMAGSALGEALSARSPWRFLLQLGIYLQELACGLLQPGCVGISRNTSRHNPFVRRTIPLGVDLSLFAPGPEGKSPEPSVLFVGALEGRKRGQFLLDCFTQVIRPRHPTATLALVSTRGPEVPGVTYYTGISAGDLAALYRRAWVYASPSTYEGFGLPYVEAMASGTPVLATPNPGSREVLADGRFGCLATDATFGQELADLLADPARRARLATLGLQRARDYTLPTMIDRYEKLLQDLCSARRRRGGWDQHGRKNGPIRPAPPDRPWSAPMAPRAVAERPPEVRVYGN
jgi:glycosyltransferase involved in cell wall biosynthesis